MYIKPSNKQLYLNYNSNHPQHCETGIPFSQSLREVERCSSQNDRDAHLENLKEKLLDRNYPDNLVTTQIDRAKQKNRSDLIYKNRKNKNKNDERVRRIFTQKKVNPQSTHGSEIVRNFCVRMRRLKPWVTRFRSLLSNLKIS